MTLWTKGHPLTACALTSPKLNQFRDTNLLRVFILEPLQILARLLVVRALTLKLRIKATYLSLEVRYLSFHCVELVTSKRKLLADNCRRAMLRNQLFDAVENAHSVVVPSMMLGPTGVESGGGRARFGTAPCLVRTV